MARNVIGSTSSPFNLKQQIHKHAGQRWEADISLPPMKRAQAEVWISFFMKLYGSYGTFTMGDPNAATPRGTAASTAGTPVVNGASQTGDTLNIDGLPTSETGYLLAGDYIQLGTGTSAQLYKVLDDVDTNASGEAALTIWPDLRSSPSDGATVVVSSAVGLFRLGTNVTDWQINQAGFYSMTFGAIEAL
jgi:hypothetical protein